MKLYKRQLGQQSSWGRLLSALERAQHGSRRFSQCLLQLREGQQRLGIARIQLQNLVKALACQLGLLVRQIETCQVDRSSDEIRFQGKRPLKCFSRTRDITLTQQNPPFQIIGLGVVW